MNDIFRKPSEPTPYKPTEGISEQVKLLQSDLGNLASKVSDITKAKFAEATSDIQHKASETSDQLEGMIRKNPTQAALAAVGIGFVLGLLLTR
jgi:ElaB/YqjD/DUF883 family membrane-anchored ribosome-binding protein